MHFFKRMLVLAAAFLAAAGLPAADLRIVTTTTDLADITKRIVGNHAAVTSIASGKEDPHFLQAKPSYIVEARKADVWIRIGMDLEIGWEGPILDGSRNRQIAVGAPGHIDVSGDVLRLGVYVKTVDRSMGHVHAAGNPHYWLDPLNGRMIAACIAENLSTLDPGHRDSYQKNLATFQKELDERMFGKELVAAVGGARLWTWAVSGKLHETLKAKGLTTKQGGWLRAMAPHRGRSIITYHRSWIYLSNRFGLKVVAELEPKPGIPPSPRHLAKVAQIARRRDVGVILLEPFYPRKAADFVAGRTEATALVCANTVGGDRGAKSYLEMLDQVISKLAKTLAER